MKLPNRKDKNQVVDEKVLEEREKVIKGKEKTRKKTEEAKNIAERSQRVVNQYKNIEIWFIKNFKAISLKIDEIMLSPRKSKFLALVIAISLVLAVNGKMFQSVFTSPRPSREINNAPLEIVGNEVYEISDVPETINVILSGDLSDIQLTMTQNKYRFFIDLKGLTEGTHQVDVQYENISPRLTVAPMPSSVKVTLRKREAQGFKLTTQFLNQNKKHDRFILGTPKLDYDEVTILASRETLDKIARVEAVIDVAGVSESFTQTAKIYAYNQQSERMEVDIMPSTVQATVNVSSPHKEVPIIVIPEGEVPNDKAIESIALQYEQVTIYAPDDVLNEINSIDLIVQASELTKKEQHIQKPIKLPTGVTYASISVVPMTITTAERSSRVIEGIPIKYTNNSGYGVNVQDDADRFAKVTIIGAEANINKFEASDLEAFIDVAKLTEGQHKVAVQIRNKGSKLVVAELASSAEISVIISK